MSVWYLELDDEITDAVARLRAAKDDRVVFVVPAGSRIGTGRINFRLLAREAASRDLRIALVSGDPQVRALAASAGLPTYASVGESERGAAGEGPLKLDAGEPTSDEGTDATATISTAPGPGPGVRTAGSRPVRRPRSRRQKVAMTAGALALVGVVGGGTLMLLYRAVPTAQVTLALAPRALGPVPIAIAVSASEQTDPSTGAVQGQLVPVTVERRVVVTATDTVSLSDRAKGSVTFTNASHATVPVPDLTQVATADGVVFLTQGAIQGIEPGGTATVDIRAAQRGDEGNVAAGAISVIVETGLATQLGEGGGVTNPDATTGGSTADKPVFSQSDYDAAVARLTADLTAGLATVVPAPEEGVVAYPGTARQSGVVAIDQAASDIVGAIGPEAQLSGSLDANVLTVDARQVEDVAQRMLAAAAAPNSVVPGARIELGEPTVMGDSATYQATGSGVMYGLSASLDDLREQVRSKTIAEAQRILGAYGTATITLSPDFLPALPDDPSRIEIRAEPPAPGATPIPMTSPSPSPVPGASGSPATSGSPDASLVPGVSLVPDVSAPVPSGPAPSRPPDATQAPAT
ncbi:MAG: hypothetical protein U0667_16160 [Chloroflexota bacterium]